MSNIGNNVPRQAGEYQNPQGAGSDNNIIIKPATRADAGALADLHYRAYYDRFFDPQSRDRTGKLYGAPLALEFPALAAGQNRQYFTAYWDDFVTGLDDPDPKKRNYCFVAFDGARALAFVKGDGQPPADDDGIVRTLTSLFNEAAACAELGSIYCDPKVKYAGLGRRLAATYVAAMRGLGYEGMITRAYARNDSPAFFEKLGARKMGDCPIPNAYFKADGTLATLEIPGVWLCWDKPALAMLK